MRSWSPLAIRVGWVNVDRSEGAERPYLWIAFSWVRKALMPIGLVAVDRALLEPLDERLPGGLAGCVAVEEEELLRVRPGQGGAEDVPVGHADDLVDVLAAARPGPGQDEPADQVGMLDDQVLGDHAAHREGEDVDLVEARAP